MKINNEVTSDVCQCSYTSWTQKYPSALGSFPKIMDSAKGKQIALFLDYDGTLSPIVDDPDHAFMSDTMRSAVRDVAKYFPTAIISGRSRDKVCEFVGLTELYYAGSHGMDIMGPVREFSADKKQSLFQPASEFLREIEKVTVSLVEKTKEIQGTKVENNKFCVSVHYRNADERNKVKIKQIVDQVLEANFKLRLTYGRKVFEIRPVIDWDKGKAVKFLLDSLGLTERADVLPIYVGDDRTDEDAFRVLKERNQGYGILVSSVPKESDAFFSLKDPSEVMEFLKSLAEQGSRNIK